MPGLDGSLVCREIRAISDAPIIIVSGEGDLTVTVELLDAGAARTADDFFHAAQVYNHGATAEDYLRAHELAVLAASQGKTQALFLSAASLDRFLRAIGRPQVFGTQYNRQGNMATMEPFDRSMSDALFNIFSIKMAGVFIFSTCTIGLRTALFPRWVAYVGYASGLLLLLIIGNWRWITLVFPFWMLVVSAQILVADRRSRNARQTTM